MFKTRSKSRRQEISADDLRHATHTLFFLPSNSHLLAHLVKHIAMEQITSQLAPRAAPKPSVGGAGGDPAGSVTKRYVVRP